MRRFPDTGEIMRLSVDSRCRVEARANAIRAAPSVTLPPRSPMRSGGSLPITRHNRSCPILPDTQWRDHRDVPVARRPQDVGHGFDECARPGVEFRTRSASSITCTRANPDFS